MSDNYGKHPSQKLQEVFSRRPFQLQEPEKAKFIILGLDANYDKDLENGKEFFQEILEYFNDGVGYWQKKGFHTPMLNPAYKSKERQPYHRNFAKLGLTSSDAQDICFLELLNVCTYGKTKENIKLFKQFLKSEDNKAHLQRISDLAKDLNKQFYICGTTVAECIRNLKLFDLNAPNVFLGKHLSYAISNEYLNCLGKEIRLFLETGKNIQLDYDNSRKSTTSIKNPDRGNSMKDYSKYIFNGYKYGKGRLVLAVVTDYVRNNPSITIDKLKEVFPDITQYDTFMGQRFGVVQTEALIKQNNWERHFFMKEEDTIHLGNEIIHVSLEWGRGNIEKFLNAAEKAGIIIEKELALNKS